MTLLITRPRYDKETHYLFYWTEGLIKEAERFVKVINLEKDKVTRKNVESYIRKHKPDIIVINGHGDDTRVAGCSNDEIIFEAGVNTDFLKGSIVYMRACDAGKALGPDAMTHGANSFIGYRELFRFWTREDKIRQPLKDDYATPFFESSNSIIVALAKGKSAPEAHVASIKAHRTAISRLLTSESHNAFLVPDLLWNMANQVCL
jgi:hypothetical protein